MKYIYVELGCAMHAPLDRNLKLQFNQEANAVCELYNRLLPACDIKYLEKIRIDLTPDLQAHTYVAPAKPLKYSFVCTIANSYNFEAFFQKNVIERKKALLEVLQQNVREAVKQLGWDIVSFEEAYQKVQEVNFINKVIWSNKFFSTKNKHYQAAVELEIETIHASISIIFFDSAKQLIKRVEVVKVRPHSLFLSKMFGKAKWLNNREFILSNKTNEIHFIASLDSDQVKRSITPILQSEQQLLNELKIFHPYTSQDEAFNLLK